MPEAPVVNPDAPGAPVPGGLRAYSWAAFSAHPPAKRRRLRNWGFRILLAAGVLALLTPVMGTPKLGFGIWYQTEAVIAAVLAASALACAGLAVLFISGAGLGRAVNWFAAAPAAAVAAWAFIRLPVSDFPGRALYGAPELGEGALWYVCLAVLIPAFSVIRRHRPSAAGLLILAAAIWGCIAAVTYIHGTAAYIIDWASETGDAVDSFWLHNWGLFLPLFFPDYLAFAGFFLIAAAAALMRRARLWLIGLCIAVGAFIVIASSNNSAIGFLALAPFIAGLYMLLRRWIGGRKTQQLAAAGGLAAAAAATIMIWLVDFQPIVNSNAPSSVRSLANSVVSRHHLLEIVEKEITASPGMLALGGGFGAFTDALAVHLPVEWISLRSDDEYISEARRARLQAAHWDAVRRVDFHSHNFFADHLMYGGLPGLILICWLFLMPVLRPPARGASAAVAAALCVMLLATVWFMPAAVLAVMALWLGWAAPRPRRKAAVSGLPPGMTPGLTPRLTQRIAGLSAVSAVSAMSAARPRILAAVFIAAALALAVTAAASVRFSHTARNFFPPMTEAIESGESGESGEAGAGRPAGCLETYHDRGQGGVRLGRNLGNMSYTLFTTTMTDGAPNPDILNMMRGLSCAALSYMAENPASLQLRIAFVRAIGDMAFMTRLGGLQGLFAALEPYWPQTLDEILAQAPKRTDLASTYLLYLLKAGDKAAFGRAAEKLYRTAPETPVAQWFYGIHLLNGANPAAGLAVMDDALENGVERFIPVDPETKAMVMGTEVETGERLTMRRLTVQTKTGVHYVDAEIAATEEAREAGLQGRLSLPAGSGMFLVFDEPQDVSMWMKNTYIPLDMIFIGENGTVLHLQERTEPESMAKIGPFEDVSYVLEVNAGFIERTGAAVGDLVRY